MPKYGFDSEGFDCVCYQMAHFNVLEITKEQFLLHDGQFPATHTKSIPGRGSNLEFTWIHNRCADFSIPQGAITPHGNT